MTTSQSSARHDTARGQARRGALVAAAAHVLRDDGFAALTHRAVATRAGLPLAATTYYFGSRDELVAEAVQALCQQQLAASHARLAELSTGRYSRAEAARAVLRVVTGVPARRDSSAELLTTYERYVQAGRDPALRPIVVQWNAQLADFVLQAVRRTHPAGATDPPLARLVLAVADGLLLTALVEGAEDPVEAVAEPLARLFGTLIR